MNGRKRQKPRGLKISYKAFLSLMTTNNNFRLVEELPTTVPFIFRCIGKEEVTENLGIRKQKNRKIIFETVVNHLVYKN